VTGRENGQSWALSPVVALRQAGFPFEMLEPYARPDSAADAVELAEREGRLRELADDLKATLREARLDDGGAAATGLGGLRPLKPAVMDSLRSRLPGAASALVQSYQDSADALADAWSRWERSYEQRLADAKTLLRDQFRADPLLRDALLLSNEANHELFAGWLDGEGEITGARGRKMTDLLTRYLQRFTAKNETHAHFGPLDAGRVDRSVRGVSWQPRSLRRRVFLAHWAAEKLAGALSADPRLADRIRPRRRPWAFERDGIVTCYAFTTEDGFSQDWEFTDAEPVSLTAEQVELFRHCDGDTALADLRARFGAATDDALAALVGNDLVVARFEVPVGVADPLPALRAQVGAGTPVDDVARDLDAVAGAGLTERPAAVTALKTTFALVTGAQANRGTGMHYADRSVFYEECHGPLGDLRFGDGIAELIETELAPVYALALAVPRLRIVRETELLVRWMSERFGEDAIVPLDRFYATYFGDRAGLLDGCDKIDAELDSLDSDLTDVLLGDGDPEAAEVVVPPERLAAFLRRCPDDPPALCNPDVMLAAADGEALARGDFLAVVGDCHGTRELLSHSSFAPLIAEEHPGFVDDVTAAYRDLVSPGELLCDLARSHPDKTATRIGLDMPDVEIYGRSSQSRDRVIQPANMYLRLAGGQVSLHAHGVPERLRLLAPPSGGPTVRLDPLAPFAFPRRLGGLVLEAGKHVRVPRIRTGRVVLQRRLWRVPVAEFAGRRPGGAQGTGNAAEFYAACLLRERHGLPRHVFVKFDSEPKPIYVDFTSPLLVRQMFRLAHGAGGLVTFSEMLPAPDQLWLHRAGGRFTTEIRCAVFSRARPPLEST
jgi:hypothetical protein